MLSRHASFGGEARLGAMVLDFAEDEVAVEERPLPGLVTHVLAALKGRGRYKFLRDMPPCPPEAERSLAKSAQFDR